MFISTQLQHTNLKTTSCTTQVRKHLPENLQEIRAGVSCLCRHGNIRTWRCMLRVPAVWKGRAQSSQVPVGLSSLLSSRFVLHFYANAQTCAKDRERFKSDF